jgi:transcriptional regulator GlxA family with amidase domain
MAAPSDSPLVTQEQAVSPCDVGTCLGAVAPAAHDAQSAVIAALRRAIDYCHRHLDAPPAVCEIAEAAGLSVRRLQEVFRTHLGTTPLSYSRRARLGAAHDDLVAIASGTATGSVTDVAIRRGFTHLSRFAQQYRIAYGCSPSATLAGTGTSTEQADLAAA